MPSSKSKIIAELEDHKRRIAELQEAEYILRIQRDLTLHLSGIDRLDETLHLCLETAIRVSGMDCGGIYLTDESSGAWVLAAHLGLPADFVAKTSRYDPESPNIGTMKTGFPIYSSDHLDDAKFFVDGRKPENLRALATIPIPYRDRIIACLNVGSQTLNEVQAASRVSLETIAGQMGLSIVRARAEEALRRSEERYRGLTDSLDVGVYRSEPGGGGRFMESNKAHIKMLGCSSLEELRGLRVIDLYVSADKRREFLDTLETLGSVRHRELNLRRRDGTPFTASISAVAVRGADGRIIHIDGIIEDISERKKAEIVLYETLREKDVLLREIHHRVKNNMQVIISLLRLQSRTVTDPERQEIFTITQDRIRSMALVHEKLYHSKNLAGIDFKSYIQSLVFHLINSAGSVAVRIKVDLQLDDVELNINKAVPCGLILNELITNALKHAFPAGRPGTVGLRLASPQPGRVRLTVEDDGVGLPEAIDIKNPATLGLQIVSDLSRQIDAEIAVERSGGTRYTIAF
jgi:PAS domain S-box-containing protein